MLGLDVFDSKQAPKFEMDPLFSEVDLFHYKEYIKSHLSNIFKTMFVSV